MKITDRILYTQILAAAGYDVQEMRGTHVSRGEEVYVRGEFSRGGAASILVVVKVHRTDPGRIDINGQPHFVTIHSDGSFDLAIAHADGPREVAR